MIHQFIFAAPKPGMTEQDFQDYWLNYHAVKFASKIKEIKKYLIDLRINSKYDVGEPLYSGIAEIWLRNDEEQIASLQSDEFLNGARLDEPNWAAFWKTLVLDTDMIAETEGAISEGVKLILIAKRANGVELTDFRKLVHDNCIGKLKSIEGISKVRLNTVRDGWYFLGEPRFDAVISLWFEDIENLYSVIDSTGNDIVKLQSESYINSNYVFPFILNEKWVIGPEERE
jgi:hypothetical protein